MDAENALKDIFFAGLSSVVPPVFPYNYIDEIKTCLSSKEYRKFFLVAFGKASVNMTETFLKHIEPFSADKGIIITKYGHTENMEFRVQGSEFRVIDLRKIKVFEAGHPVPDESGLHATQEVTELLNRADTNTLVVCLISGGGSSLLVSPCKGITLKDKQKATDNLLRAGADIRELNTVRKHISRVKGGRLAEIASPSKVISFVISDVIGDPLDVIASGPTVPDESTFHDALSTIRKYSLEKRLPESIVNLILKGCKGQVRETPKMGDSIFRRITNVIIANNSRVMNGALNKAQKLGFSAEIIKKDISGEARDVGRLLAKKAIDVRNKIRLEKGGKKTCLISGGETTVTVRGNGKGGRNTELALSFAMEIEGVDGVSFLSAGTDGTDGPTDAAGAIVDGSTIKKARAFGLNPEEYLQNNDSYTFFNKLSSLLFTGPTGTNVMDMQVVLIE
jgi:glycerate-2-kinase